MKVAYLILAHQDPIHLLRLTDALSLDSKILIHLDKKTNISAYSSIVEKKEVTFIKDRVNVYWGGISMVLATLNLIKAALEDHDYFSHLVFISGLDYPIKPIQKFYNFLDSNKDRQFIKFVPLSKAPLPSERRMTEYWFMEPFQGLINDVHLRLFLQKSLRLLTKKMLPKNLPLWWGSANWVITSDCADFILKYLEQNPSILQMYKYTHCPDEHFFHTLIANSPFFEMADGYKVGMRWPHEVSNITLNFQGRVFGDCDYEFIKDLSLNQRPTKASMSSDIYRLMGRSLDRNLFDYSSFFFARKFTTQFSSSLLDKIDHNLI